MKHLLLSFVVLFHLFSTHAEIIPVGNGSYTNTLPVGAKPPGNSAGNSVKPKVVSGFSKPIISHQWWSSLIWQFDPQNPYSQSLFAYPLSFKARAKGLDVGYTVNPAVTPDITTGAGWKAQEYHYDFQRDLTISLTNLNSIDTKVVNYSDWTVTARWQSDSSILDITMGKGLPFVYCKTSVGAAAVITFPATPSIWYKDDEVVGLSINNKHYALFAPIGSTWQGTTTLTTTLNNKNYFSVALLPDNTLATLQLFRKHAYAFVTDTKVSWNYDDPSARLTTTYTLTTQLQETGIGLVNQPLVALFRHQWLHTNAATLNYSYASARGAMKLIESNSFNTQLLFPGIIPTLPLVAQDGIETYNANQLYGYVDTLYKQSYATRWNGLTTSEDTYWIGKAMGKIAQLILIADQIKHTNARDLFIKELKEKLEGWLSASNNDTKRFYYDNNWDTLIGYPASFFSDTQLNDHHFHYGYFIHAAAIIALFDQAWATDSAWGGMIKLLIKDAQNWERSDARFPFLGFFDIYEAHGWANGPSLFGAGNNQESSSEAINFATGVFLWGAATNNEVIRDLGIYLYTNETQAIKEYWFDVNNAVFPNNFTKPTLGIVWGNGGAYAIWFAGDTEQVHGINFLPINTGSLHMGHYPNYMKTNLDYMFSAQGDNALSWPDIILSAQALYSPSDAIKTFNNNSNYSPEPGDSKAHTYHWIHNLNALGLIDTNITANIPTYAVFNKNGNKTYIAHNPTNQPIIVTFSDGKQLNVAAYSLANSKESLTPPAPTGPAPEPNPTGPQPPPATSDYNIELVTSGLTIKFKPTSPATFVDIHYKINGTNQQNNRMINQSGTWLWTINNLKIGDVISYSFTYTKNGLAYDSVWYTVQI